LPGLAVVIALLTNVIGGGLRRHFRIMDPQLRSVSAALLAVLIWNIVYAVKAQNMDLDPMDVYFWLFVGLLARVYALDRATTAAAQVRPRIRSTAVDRRDRASHPARVPVA
jgi:membrane-bound metal-dependent hydrolase YbcI (DUF457 family)